MYEIEKINGSDLRWNMDKGKAVMGAGRRWGVDFSDQSTVPSSRDILDPPGFSRASPEQVLDSI